MVLFFSGPRMGALNGNNNRRPPNVNRISSTERPFYAQHDDLIKYIFDSWNKISQEVDRNTGNNTIYYQEQENQNLKNFEPFDLQAYWARQVVQNIQQSQS